MADWEGPQGSSVTILRPLRITNLYSQLAFPNVARLLLGYMAVQAECRTKLANSQVVALLSCFSILQILREAAKW
jgi:hypothetical protein